MTDCAWLSDRMPMVAVGQTEWTPEELRHLSACPTCQQEWEMVRVVNRMGNRAVISFDSPAMASSVIQRLERQRDLGRLRRRTWSFTGVAAAAAIAAVVWAGGIERQASSPASLGPPVAGRLAIPLPELDGLQPAELGAVLQMMEEPNVGGLPVDEPALGDLNSDELERVLDSWEG